MLTDKQKIEDCIIPALLYGTVLAHTGHEDEVWKSYVGAIQIINSFVYVRVKGDARLLRRLDRITRKLSTYFVDNKFTTQCSFLVISEWSRALSEAGAVCFEEGIDVLLKGIEETIIEKGYALEGFKEIDAKAIDHIPVIHAIARSEGYFE